MATRPRTSRLRRALLAALVAASVAVPVSGAAGPAAVPAPAPAELGPLGPATDAALDERYAAGRADILAAERTAAVHGDRRRAAVLRAMADPGRRFLSFDGRDGGRTAEVFGDLAHAEHIAVLVPGSDTSLDSYGRFGAGAEALRRELGDGAAVIAWLGYKTPGTVSRHIVTDRSAAAAAPGLAHFVRELTSSRPGSRMTLLCHSYGAVVCGLAAADLPVADIVLYGSPGTGARDVESLRTRATVWAGRGADDWIADVPHRRLDLGFVTVGFGTDPVSPSFGARVFDAGPGGHSDYLRPGSVPLRNLARIVRGHALSTEPGHA
ncbi:hypothetical protein F0344_30605 [Streptomyces finlayi]|uniref:DUF1023 domain-containing protein n=1 Tax=Streptomyces finlayi TaxID=67296 RepID=A0A7G7BSR2_9ACTN|nr:alpha/beta hydrolase [Streptomyces finlayi]QNE78377.1 hypothetical protein F0344_30605 [Streptomyces finlayi]